MELQLYIKGFGCHCQNETCASFVRRLRLELPAIVLLYFFLQMHDA